MPLWLDEDVAQVVGALVARKVGVGYVDQVVLEDCAARDVLKAPVLAADESFRVVGTIPFRPRDCGSPGCLTAAN